jgi:hypothetical protein
VLEHSKGVTGTVVLLKEADTDDYIIVYSALVFNAGAHCLAAILLTHSPVLMFIIMHLSKRL